jgi:hypothetical protein
MRDTKTLFKNNIKNHPYHKRDLHQNLETDAELRELPSRMEKENQMYMLGRN